MSEEKGIDEMTREEIENVPSRDWNESVDDFDSLIILPMEEIHDSGYRIMNFVAVTENKPVCKLSGCSDVININGIGGMGKDWGKRGYPRLVKPESWSIDCLKVSGLFRLFSSQNLSAGRPLSSFEIFSVPKEIIASEKETPTAPQ